MHRFGRDLLAMLANWAEIVENPERTPVGRHHQIVALHHQIVYRRHRQIELKRLPLPSPVIRNEHAVLRAREQQILPHRIFPHRPDKRAIRNPLRDKRPTPAEVGRLINVWAHVVVLVPVDRQIGRPRRVRRSFDQAHTAPLRHLLRRDIGPVLASVPRDMNQPVVGARPDQPLLKRRFGHRENRVVKLRSGIVDIHRPARRLLLALIVARQIRTDRLPMHAAIGRFEQSLARVIQNVGIVKRDQHRRGPLKAVVQNRRAHSIREPRENGDVLKLPVMFVEPRDVALIGARIDDRWVARIGSDVARFPAPDVVPFRPADRSLRAAAGDGDGRIVLLRAVNVIGEAVIRNHVVKLRRRLVTLRRPAFPSVQSHRRSSIVGLDHAVGVERVDPQSMIVAMRHVDAAERSSPVDRPDEFHVQNVQHVRVLRIGDDVHVIPRPLRQPVLAVNQRPLAAPVVGAIEPTALFRFHQRPHPV